MQRCWAWILLLTTVSQVTQGSKNHTRLLKKLFSEYDPDALPTANATEVLGVTLNVLLQSVVDVDERDELLITYIWTELMWTDAALTWNPAEYGGITQLSVAMNRIWQPDVVLYNSGGRPIKATHVRNVEFTSSGSVYLSLPTIYKSSCEIDVSYFPFDEQLCEIRFGLWSYDASEVILSTTPKDDLTAWYSPNGAWNLKSSKVGNDRKDWGWEYTFVVATLDLKRKSGYFALNIVAPSMVCSLMSLFVFLLPPDSGEKTGLGITIFLALTVFALIISDILPRTSSATPLIAKYFAASMLLSTLTLAVTMIVLNLNARKNRKVPMPRWLRIALNQLLARLVCMRFDCRCRRKPKRDKEATINGQENHVMITRKGSAPESEFTFGAAHVELTERETAEWEFSARVVDRFCFFMFTIAHAATACYFFIIVPQQAPSKV